MSRSIPRLRFARFHPPGGPALLLFGFLVLTCRGQVEESPPPPPPSGDGPPTAQPPWSPPTTPNTPGNPTPPGVKNAANPKQPSRAMRSELQATFLPPPPVAPAPVEASLPLSASGALSVDEVRDPFWPVDYVPPQLSATSSGSSREALLRKSEAEWHAAEKLLTIRGASRLPLRDGTSELCALINGESVRVGGECGVTWNGKTFRWRVRSISLKTGPVLERVLPAPGGREKAP